MISAFEVIRAIDGPLFITSCITVRGECDQSERCTIREPLRRVNDSIEQVLRRITILDMKEESDETHPGRTGIDEFASRVLDVTRTEGEKCYEHK